MNRSAWSDAQLPRESAASLAQRKQQAVGNSPFFSLSDSAIQGFLRFKAASPAQGLAVSLGFESNQNTTAAEVEHRPLDHRGLLQHQRDGLFLVDAGLGLVGEFLEGGAGAIEQRLPAGLL